MIYRLYTVAGVVEVTVRAESPVGLAPISYQGNPKAVQTVREWLSEERGLTGHILGEFTSPVDLQYVLESPAAGVYSPELLEGTQLKNVSLGIPEGAVG